MRVHVLLNWKKERKCKALFSTLKIFCNIYFINAIKQKRNVSFVVVYYNAIIVSKSRIFT